jgi:putative Ca2+/H+ antiporter (TMEM165/GDT1 family)
MNAFLVSVGVVAISEIGDKTQLLALLLAARYRQPWPIIAGIFTATIFNHAIAGLLGGWLATAIDPTWLRWGLGVLFIGMGAWALVPDTLDTAEVKEAPTRWAVFAVTTVAFFLAEIGDKTQIATAALGARFGDIVAVVTGTTLGMLIADVPAVIFGQVAADKVRAGWVRYVAAAIFVGLGVLTIITPLP